MYSYVELVYKSNSCVSQPPFSMSKIWFFIISSQRSKIQTKRSSQKINTFLRMYWKHGELKKMQSKM